MRKENDFIGSMEIPTDALFGIHSQRAATNFPDSTPFPKEWYVAVALVKKSYYLTAKRYFFEASKKYDLKELKQKKIADDILDALIESADALVDGSYFDHFIVPAIQGGAGTSINMNINEIISNLALVKLGKQLGDYSFIDPVEHANVFQSTNDVIPTALRIAVMRLLLRLEEEINKLRKSIERKEDDGRDLLRLAYTQMQEAVPTSFGRLFSAYSDALSRDWWRVSKCFERIKTVNLGGSAIGSGITVPKFVIMEVVQQLKQLCNLPITRSENMYDNTANLDVFVEVHATLKAHAVNLEKMSSDLRLLSSDLLGQKEISIPQKQVGSSIMPGKSNPVITEFVVSASHAVYANDMLIGSLCGQGCLELNAYLPIIGHKLIESIKLLIGMCVTLRSHLIDDLSMNGNIAHEKLIHSSAVTTALLPIIGYRKAEELAKMMQAKRISIFEANEQLAFLASEDLKNLMSPKSLLREGYSLKDIT